VKRSKEEAEKTRQALLDAALNVFHRRGVTRATLQEVAAEAGVTRGAVYWHFKDKSHLYLTLYEELTARYSVRPEDFAAKQYETLEEFRDDLDRLISSYQQDRKFRMFIQILHSRMEYIEEMKEIVENEQLKQQRMVAAYAHALTLLQSKGQISPHIDCARAGILIFTVIDGIFDSWGIDEGLFHDDLTPQNLLHELLDRLVA
jgi:TetR/AcrR family acrAB operon transcriptional repressor